MQITSSCENPIHAMQVPQHAKNLIWILNICLTSPLNVHSLSQQIHEEEMGKEDEKGDQGLIKEGIIREEKEVKTI